LAASRIWLEYFKKLNDILQANMSVKSTFIGEGITPAGISFSTAAMAAGKPGLPEQFTWKGKEFSISAVLEEWKESGPCSHGSGERYVRKHWFHVKTNDGSEMKIYFERQKRSSTGSRWRLYSIIDSNETKTPDCRVINETGKTATPGASGLF
jgi:phosphoribosylglycinamide formyltransferase-1